jgi:hypothetical protein
MDFGVLRKINKTFSIFFFVLFCFVSSSVKTAKLTKKQQQQLGHHSIPVARLVRRIPARNGRMDYGAQGSRQQGILRCKYIVIFFPFFDPTPHGSSSLTRP